MFVIGGGVVDGLHDTYPSLTHLASGDLRMSVDFPLGVRPEPAM